MTRGRERERGYELKLFGNMALPDDEDDDVFRHSL